MGETPLIRAGHNGHLATVKFLVGKGADVNSIDMVSGCRAPAGATAPGSAVEEKTPPALTPAPLLQCRPPVEQGDNTALHWAAMRGHVEIVKFLLSSGADRTLRNKQEKIAIDLAQPCWSNAYRFTREVLAA